MKIHLKVKFDDLLQAFRIKVHVLAAEANPPRPAQAVEHGKDRP